MSYRKTPRTLILDKCTPLFTAAFFTAVEIWKQPKCPSMDEWTKKQWYAYPVEYYSAVK